MGEDIDPADNETAFTFVTDPEDISIARFGSWEDDPAAPFDDDDLDVDEAQRILDELTQEPVYDRLKQRVTERGEQLRPERSVVISVEDENPREIINISIDDSDSDKANLSIGRELPSGEPILAVLEYEEKEGNTIEQTVFDATGDSSSLQQTTRTIDLGAFRESDTEAG